MADLIADPGLFAEVSRIVAERGIRALVESGTGESSSGMRAARALGILGYTCDIRWECARRAHELYPDFEVYHANSENALKDCLPKIVVPAFFWLDGHCPTDSGVLKGGVFPLYDELLLIKALKYGYERDVIWCDDVHMIIDPANPTAEPVDQYLPDSDTHWTGDGSHTWDQYLAVFAETHDAEVDREARILKLTPKVAKPTALDIFVNHPTAFGPTPVKGDPKIPEASPGVTRPCGCPPEGCYQGAVKDLGTG